MAHNSGNFFLNFNLVNTLTMYICLNAIAYWAQNKYLTNLKKGKKKTRKHNMCLIQGNDP